MEIWKDITGYAGLYEISNFGNINSITRYVKHSAGGTQILRGRKLKFTRGKNKYLKCSLSLNGIQTTYRVHQLMALVFLNHTGKNRKFVVDHIDNNPLNNRLDNLQIVTNRVNSSKDKKGYSSKYVGVYFRKHTGKYEAGISINRKLKYLGAFEKEYDAHLAYQNEIKKLNETIPNN